MMQCVTEAAAIKLQLMHVFVVENGIMPFACNKNNNNNSITLHLTRIFVVYI